MADIQSDSAKSLNVATAALPLRQAPGFLRVRIGDLLVTAVYDGFVPVLAEDLRGEPQPRISRLLGEAFLDPGGDRHTAVIGFLVEYEGQRVLIDAGSGDSLGPDTGHLLSNLAAAQVDPADIDHVLLTHLHPDHAGGLVYDNGRAAFPHATVRVANADADHWLDPRRSAAAVGVRRQLHDTVFHALAPYRETGRFVTFRPVDEVIPGVHAIDLAGHSPGHTGYVLGVGEATVLFWGDTVHSYSVQLRRPSVSMAGDSDEYAAIRARRKAFDLAASNRWWVGGAHMPFPGLGRLRRYARRYVWQPVAYAPVG
jgi:glyoxylase-like metal-dependent hydrolase (beta-lactamase superfamily II)